MITSTGLEGPSGLTASAVCSLSIEPLLLIACLDQSSRTLAAVRRSRRIGINVLARHQQALASAFASKAPEAEKFQGVAHREIDGVPVLDGVVAWLTGEVRELLEGGDHVIAVTEVRSTEAPGGDPLVYFRGAYRALA